MSRLITVGAEANHVHVDDIAMAGTSSIVSSPVHSGNFSYSVPSAVIGNFLTFNWTGVIGRWFYIRAWFLSTALPPSGTRQIAGLLQGTVVIRPLFQHPDGTISSNAIYGATPHSPPVPINEWHCFEIGAMNDGSNFFWKMRLDGTEFSSLSITSTQTINRIRFGVLSGATDASTTYFDDLAINDDQGVKQNSWPNVLGKIVLITPTSDQTVGANWALGQGTAPAGLAYDSVNNIPPLGVANNAAGSDPKQIRNAVASIAQPAADVDLKCAAYSTVVPAGNGIKVLAPIFELGHSSGSLTSHVDVGLIDKPSQASTDALIPAGAASTFPGVWNRFASDVVYDPVVVLSDQPVLRIGRRTATALTQVCCFAGLILEYEPLPPSGDQKFLAVA